MMGIARGKVTANWEKSHPGMVQVVYRLGETGEMKSDWIPVMTPFGGKNYGAYLLPEVGSSVIIGFEQGSLNCPVVLGCLWDQEHPLPPDSANEKNSRLMWKSKSGYLFFVEEEEKEIRFSDPDGKNTMVWSTGKKSLTLTIEGAFQIKASEDIQIKGKNITLSSGQKTTIKGTQAEIAPTQKLTLKTQQMAAEATALELKAQASGKVQSGGILEVQGSLLKLN